MNTRAGSGDINNIFFYYTKIRLFTPVEWW
jgi:hypothetical protein